MYVQPELVKALIASKFLYLLIGLLIGYAVGSELQHIMLHKMMLKEIKRAHGVPCKSQHYGGQAMDVKLTVNTENFKRNLEKFREYINSKRGGNK